MADDDMDFYELLEIDEDASQEEVKEAFRSKVREYHPDLNDDPDAPAQFNALKKAYETLNDSSERNAYDRLGHKNYVAKRIGGFPSGDIWGNRSSSSDSGGSKSRSAKASTGSSGSTGAGRGRSSSSSRSSGSRTSGNRSSKSSSGSGSRSRSSSAQSTTTTGSSRSTASATGTSSSRSTGASAAGTSTGGGRSTTGTQSTGRARSKSSGGWTDNALFNWWNDLSLGWPLMLSAVLLYVGGLAQYALAHESGLSTLAGRLSAAGTDVAALQAALTEPSRYGLAQPATFIVESGSLVTEPPLPTQQWYYALAGLVGGTVLLFGLNRAFRARRPYKWVTINETVGVSLALAIAAGAFGGPLLAGAVVMPLVYLVIIRHTRMAFQFKPTYLYVVGVSAPLVALVLDAAEAAPMLAVDLVAMVLPLLTVATLLLSAFVRPKIAARF